MTLEWSDGIYAISIGLGDAADATGDGSRFGAFSGATGTKEDSSGAAGNSSWFVAFSVSVKTIVLWVF